MENIKRLMRSALGNLHRTLKPLGSHDFSSGKPLGRDFGARRGTPVDRYYIERFLEEHKDDIRGHVLEFGSRTYTDRFGSAARSDVLHAVEGNREATIVGDLVSGGGLENRTFDCIVCTQTLPFISDVRAAVRTLHAALCSGGILLLSVPCIAQISRHDMERWGDYWRFTSLGVRTLIEEYFPAMAVTAYGNLFAATAMLHGVTTEECEKSELDRFDPEYEVIVCARAVRS